MKSILFAPRLWRTLSLAAGLACGLPSAQASFLSNDLAQQFVEEMVTRHGFERQYLFDALHQAQFDQQVIRLITPSSAPSARSWQNYRGRFLAAKRINEGVDFWHDYRDTIEAASERFGVPPEIIVAIIGVETHYGNYTGNFQTLSALASLAFNYPPRAELFRKELENLFLLAREQNRDPASFSGSYAGAIGYPQFLPSSIRNYAIDFDGNGIIDFESNPLDAIASVANYLAAHGWRRNEPIAVRVSIPAGFDPTPLIQAGIEPTLAMSDLQQHGIRPQNGNWFDAPATFVDLVTPGAATQYWLGYRNFYVITRYNRSSFYAMAVFELAEALRENMPR